MRAVLGIDAAWTVTEPTGVALCVEENGRWRCAGVAPSYGDFVGLADGVPVNWLRRRIPGELPDVARLLEAARALAPGATIEAVAIDMPLALSPITARREADQAISRVFGPMKCSVHSPTSERPGRLSASIRDGFAAEGFALATFERPDGPAILEVFPHTALLSLCQAAERLPYKVSKARKYWPDAPPAERRRRLVAGWRDIGAALSSRIAFDLQVPASFETFASMKRYEDALDALVCAWIAIEFLEGRVVPFGDRDAAIWTFPAPGAGNSFSAAR